MMTQPACRTVRYSGRACDECARTDRYLERTIEWDNGKLWGHVCSKRCERAVLQREEGLTLIRPDQSLALHGIRE